VSPQASPRVTGGVTPMSWLEGVSWLVLIPFDTGYQGVKVGIKGIKVSRLRYASEC
jgi:hypothetical protein